MNGEALRKALHAGERVYGTCVVSPSPHWPAMIAGSGLDFVFIDTEHIALDRTMVAWMCQTYAARGVAPIVRIPRPDPYQACMMLDGGAMGVVAPYVESVEEVRQLRGAVHYRPLKGELLQRVLDGKETLDEVTAAYLATNNRNNCCIVNIESTPALEAIDTILAEPGIDALLIGPHDLSISLGIPEQYRHPRFTEAIHFIIQKGRAAGVGVGFHYSFGIEETLAWAKAGANFIIHASDYFLVRDVLKADLARFHTELGDVKKAAITTEDMTTI